MENIGGKMKILKVCTVQPESCEKCVCVHVCTCGYQDEEFVIADITVLRE